MNTLALALAVATLLGLRHATDPDHLTAVSTLVMSDKHSTWRRASSLGLAWGLGHATTLIALGLPVVLFERELPGAVGRIAEIAVGLLIVALAARLLVRWRRGYIHVHAHSHGPVRHAHPHVHDHRDAHADEPHEHRHVEALGRSPLAAYGIGLVHGVGGSAAASVLVIASVTKPAEAAVALLLFAFATAVSMALCSAAFGLMLTREPVARRLETLTPALGALGLTLGVWYVLGALPSVSYPL
jgi:high-affinity nickel permease